METEATYFGRLDRAIETALDSMRRSEGPVTLLFSGGVDSTLLAWELRERLGLQLLTVGTLGSRDLGAARTAAELLRLPWIEAKVDRTDIDRVLGHVHSQLLGASRIARSVIASLALALERSPTRKVIVGQGADELFLGYAHFRGLEVEGARARAEADLERLLKEDWPRTLRVAEVLGRSLEAPYLNRAFVDAAQSIPIERRRPDPVPKAFFRAWAERRGLPSQLAQRPKRAFQYGSGVDRALPRR